ncbi:MAG: DUF3794 domain-containing protein [Clostridia bacterium]
MAFESSSTKIAIKNKKILSVTELATNSRILIADGKNVSKVISVKSTEKVTAFEKTKEELTMKGQIFYSLIVELATGEVTCVEQVSEFEGKIKLDDGYELSVGIACKDINISSVSSSEIVVESIMELTVMGLTNEVLDIFSSNSESVVKETENIEVNSVVATVSSFFNVACENEVFSSVDKILNVNATVILNNCKVSEDMVIVDGKIIRSVLFLDEEGKMKTEESVIDFCEEVPAVSAKVGQFASAELCLNNISVKASMDEEGSKGHFITTAEIKVEVAVFEKVFSEILVDLFSTEEELLPIFETYSANEFKTFTLLEGRATNTCESLYSGFEDFFVLESKVYNSSIVYEDGLVNISGVIMSKMIAKNVDTAMFDMQEFSMPFETVMKSTEQIQTGGESTAKVSAVLTGMKRKGDSYELNYDVFAEVKSFTSNFVTYVKEVNEIEDKKINDNSILVYRKSATESLFDVCKALGVSKNIVISQNGDVDFEEPTENTIIIYKQKEAQFKTM